MVLSKLSHPSVCMRLTRLQFNRAYRQKSPCPRSGSLERVLFLERVPTLFCQNSAVLIENFVLGSETQIHQHAMHAACIFIGFFFGYNLYSFRNVG